MPLSSAERRVVAAVDVEEMVVAIRSLVAMESWNGHESEAQDFIASLMSRSGLDVDRWDIDLDEVRRHPFASWEIERSAGVGVVGTLAPDADAKGRCTGRALLLNGHVDVVPPGDTSAWRHPPFGGVVDEGRIHGRGALDMKGPLLAGLFALRALRAADVRLSGPVHFMSVIGEEDGGMGTLASLLRGYRADGAIVMEPTDLTIAPVGAGCVNFRIHVPGLSAHGALREEGVNAFEKLFVVYTAIQALESSRNQGFGEDPLFARYRIPFPISVGTMRGGDWASSVPDHVLIEGRMGVRPDEDLDTARSALDDAVTGAAAADPFLRGHPPRVTWWGGCFQPTTIDTAHPIVTSLAGAAGATTGHIPDQQAVPFGSDAGLLTRVGQLPTVLYGAGDIRRAHRCDEYVEIEDLTCMARVLAVTAMRFCGVAGVHPPA